MELPPDLRREIMPDTGIAVPAPAHERDGFGDDMVGGQQEVGEPLSTVRLEDFVDARVVLVVRADVGEEEARIEEDHSPWPP